MKMLLDPDWIDLVVDLSPEDCRALVLAIFDYPNRECNLPVWRFIKRQLDKDAVKYHAKCARLAEVRPTRWVSEQKIEKSEQNETEIIQKSDAIALANSKEQGHINSINNSKDMQRRTFDLIKHCAAGFHPDRAAKFTIEHDFSFAEMMRRNPALAETFGDYSSELLQRAQTSLIKKCYGEQKTLSQILGWINQEGKF